MSKIRYCICGFYGNGSKAIKHFKIHARNNNHYEIEKKNNIKKIKQNSITLKKFVEENT